MAVADLGVSHEPVPFTFTGTGREYFRIWIVNVLLSIVTLGVYSAWAKVRRLQYFSRHTRLAGASFEYHGSPVAILKGRMIAVALLGGYYLAGLISPLFGLAAAGVLAIIFPWLLARALRFRLYNSSYRGIRFHFTGTTRSAYGVVLGLGLATVLTLFTLGPFWHQRLKRYQHGQAAFGRTRFTFTAPVGDFYVAYVAALFLGISVIVVLVILMILFGITLGLGGGSNAPSGPPMTFFVMTMTIYALGLLLVRAFVRARLQNVIWNHTQLGAHRFMSVLGTADLFGVLITNVAATIGTLGLFLPFAQIRMAQYLANRFTVLPGGSLDEFEATDAQAATAVGEEAADMFDFDIAF